MLVLGTVMSHLDYCNSVLVGLPDVDISKMQHIQNIAAKMVVSNDVNMKDSNSRNILAKLHWLPIRRRIQYKIITLVHKCLASGVPKYLNNLLAKYTYAERRQGLRSQHQERRLVELKTGIKPLRQGPSAVLVQNCGTDCPMPLRPLRILNNLKTNFKPIFLKRNSTARICFSIF